MGRFWAALRRVFSDATQNNLAHFGGGTVESGVGVTPSGVVRILGAEFIESEPEFDLFIELEDL